MYDGLEKKMMWVSIALGVIGIIPAVGDFTDAIWIVIFLIVWIPRRGMKLLDPRVFFIFIISILISFIPFLGWVQSVGNWWIRKIMKRGEGEKSEKKQQAAAPAQIVQIPQDQPFDPSYTPRRMIMPLRAIHQDTDHESTRRAA